MFRSQYDSDVTLWSPDGRLYQLQYAMEAVKQGSATVGAKSATHVVLAAVKRVQSELAFPQKKIFKVDEHMGVSIAGLTADARVLSKYMRKECLQHRFVYDSAAQVQRLAHRVAAKSEVGILSKGSRPYGVGLLIAGYDKTGTHLLQTSPSGSAYDYVAQSIGARSQSARTYLEKHFKDFDKCSKDELIKHVVLALRETVPSDMTLTASTLAIGVVGVDTPFTIIEGDDAKKYLEMIGETGEERPPRDDDDDDDAAAAAAADGSGAGARAASSGTGADAMMA